MGIQMSCRLNGETYPFDFFQKASNQMVLEIGDMEQLIEQHKQQPTLSLRRRKYAYTRSLIKRSNCFRCNLCNLEIPNSRPNFIGNLHREDHSPTKQQDNNSESSIITLEDDLTGYQDLNLDSIIPKNDYFDQKATKI